MSIDPASRYAGVGVGEWTTVDIDGRERVVRYVRRRTLPDYTNQPTIAEHRVTGGDRLDDVTARYLGNPEQFWRICDANVVLRPEELEELGRLIRIAISEQ